MKRCTAVLVIILLITSSLITAFGADSDTCYLIDSFDDSVYTIYEKSKYVEVYKNGEYVQNLYPPDFLCCSVYNGVISFFRFDALNSIVTVTNCNLSENTAETTAINGDAVYIKYCFAKDTDGVVYYVSAKCNTKLCISTPTSTDFIDAGAFINQLMCIDGENLIVVTSNNIQILKNNSLYIICEYAVNVPLVYCGNNLLEDASGNTFIYRNANLEEYNAQTSVATADILPDVSTDNTGYICSDLYIAEAGTTVSKIKSSIGAHDVVEITKADGNIITVGKVGTGTQILLTSGTTLTVIIKGELTSEGNINSKDTKAALDNLSGKSSLGGAYLTAADIDLDGEITTKDALLISKMY